MVTEPAPCDAGSALDSRAAHGQHPSAPSQDDDMSSPIIPLPASRPLQHLVAAHRIFLALQSANWGAVALGLLSWREGGIVLILNLLAMIGLVLCPRCRLLGPNVAQLPAEAAATGAVALTFDDGPDPAVTPHVLDILDRYGARASFFCVGERALRHPELIHEILRRGHTIENHSHRHAAGFAGFGAAALLADILAAQQALSDIGGRAPRYFRAPMGFRSPLLAEALRRLDLTHVAWTRRGYDRLLRDPRRIVRRLTRNLAVGDILLLHDSDGRIGGAPVVLEALPLLLEQLAAQGLHAIALPDGLAEAAAEPIQQPHWHR